MPKSKEIVEAISNNKALLGHTLIEELLAEKTALILKETKKQLVAKTWGVIKEQDEKAIFKKGKRKAFKEKMHQLKFGGESK